MVLNSGPGFNFVSLCNLDMVNWLNSRVEPRARAFYVNERRLVRTLVNPYVLRVKIARSYICYRSEVLLVSPRLIGGCGIYLHTSPDVFSY